MWTLCRILFLLTIAPFASMAQQTNVGAITGTTRDSSGGVIPGVALEVVNQATGLRQQAVTGDNGVFIIPLLPLGTYTVSASKTGFKKVDRVDIPVTAGTTSTIDFELPVGEITDNVTVTAASPALDTTTTNMGTSRTSQELADLPIPMAGGGSRGAAGFIRTMAGVNYTPGGGPDWIQVSRAQINGIQPGQFGYQIDGLDAGAGEAESGQDLVAPTPDSVEEVRLTTNTDASMGNNGGVALAMTLKSGTNDFHGSGYYYMMNDAVNARSFFAARPTKARQHEPGITFGGPLIIPKVYNGRNKTFFFTSIDVYRDKNTSAQTTTVPTELMRRGDFSQLLGAQIGTDALGRPIRQGAIYDPLTTRSDGSGGFLRDPFPGNVIDSARLSPVSLAFQNKIALPTRLGVSQNWVGVTDPPLVNVKDQWMLKIDHNLNSNHRFTFSYESSVPWFLGRVKGKEAGRSGYSATQLAAGWLAPEIDATNTDDRDQYRYRLTYVWVMSSTAVFNLRMGITRDPNRNNYPVEAPDGPNWKYAAVAGLKGTLSSMTPWVNSMPGFFEGGQGAFGPRFGEGLRPHSQRTPFGLDWTWNKGRHNYKFGADYQILSYIFGDRRNVNGTFAFSPVDTGFPNRANTGVSYASFLLGEVNNGSVSTPIDIKVTTGGFGFYAQDHWRVSSRWTVNYGLRWDLFTPTHEQYDRLSTFDHNRPNPGAGGRLGALSFYGNGPGRNGLTAIHDYFLKALGPKLGIAYSPNPKTVVRVTAGISYYPFWQKYFSGSGPMVPTIGFSATSFANTTSQLQPAFNWTNGFPGTFPALPNLDPTLVNGGTATYLDRGQNRPAMVENFGFEVGRELPHKISVRVGYVGTMAHRIPIAGWNQNAMPLQYLSLGNLLNANINSPEARAAGIPIPYPGFTGSVSRALQPYPQYTSVVTQSDAYGNSTYNALQVNIQKQFGDLVFLTNFTASKMLTNANFSGSLGFGGGDFQHPDLRDKEGKLIGARDRARILNVSWVYELPFGSGKHFLGNAGGVLNQVVRGWRISAVQAYMSGDPFTVSSRQTIPGIGGVRPILVPGVPIQLRGCGDIDPNDPTRNRYIDINAFRDPSPFTLGNFRQPPNVRNCGYLSEDLGVQKDTAFGEDMRLRFGAIMVNAFNRHAWTGLQTDIGNPASFGTFTGSTAGRTIQFFMKFLF